MDDYQPKTEHTHQVGALQPRNRDSMGDSASVGTQEGRPDRDLSNRQPARTNAPRIPGSDGGTAASQTSGTPDVNQSPLAQMHRLIEKAGEEPFPDDIIHTLSEPIDDSLVDIKPNGAIFVSHPHYRDRLDRAFGVGGWALVPLAQPKTQGNRVVWWGFLKARGQYIGDAVGGCTYIVANSEMNWDDAAEGAKSDCLARCCKALPMFRECWDKEYADYWKATYAQEVAMPRTKSGKGWKKQGAAMRNFDVRPGRAEESEYHRQDRLEDANQAHIDSIPGNKPLKLASKDEYEDHADYYDDVREE